LERERYRLSLETGNTPDFDVIGESMAPVQENMAKLTAADRKAIAAYIKSLPPRPDAVPKSKQKDEEKGDTAKSGADNGAKQPDDSQ
jgi:mono/diheme cytochrome c family protein